MARARGAPCPRQGAVAAPMALRRLVLRRAPATAPCACGRSHSCIAAAGRHQPALPLDEPRAASFAIAPTRAPVAGSTHRRLRLGAPTSCCPRPHRARWCRRRSRPPGLAPEPEHPPAHPGGTGAPDGHPRPTHDDSSRQRARPGALEAPPPRSLLRPRADPATAPATHEGFKRLGAPAAPQFT
jgi:hypothetical protein